MAASRAMYSAQITCQAINCNRLIRNALPYPPDTPSLPRNFDANKYCSVACAGRGTQRICALSSCQQQAVATISCPHCRGMPQTDPDTVFPNYGYCTKEHLDQDAGDHQERCTQRRDAAWLRFVDDAVNTACHEERKALYARVVTGDPYFLDKDYVFFSQRSANQSGERGMMFPTHMRESDRQSVLFFHACRCTIRITTYMVAFLSQDLPVDLSETHVRGVIPNQEMVIYNDLGGYFRYLAELHTMIKIVPRETIADNVHESLHGGIYLDPSRPQYRYKQGAVKCTRYPVDPTIPSPIKEVDFGSEYQQIKEGRDTRLPTYSMSFHRHCLAVEISACTINNVLWDVVTKAGGLQALRAMNVAQRGELLCELQMRWRVEFRKMRDQFDDVYFPTQQDARARTGAEKLGMLQDIMNRAMGEGHKEAFKALNKVLNCTA